MCSDDRAVDRKLLQRKQRLVAVCGVKNAGKTTLIEGLIRELGKRGKKTAVIKHDGHDFSCDVPGTDSYRFGQAGAYGTAVFSKNRVFLHKVGTGEGIEELLELFPEADVILIEGMKESTYPKIEVVRKELSTCPVSNPRGRFLIVTDCCPQEFAEKTAGFEEISKIAEELLRENESDEV